MAMLTVKAYTLVIFPTVICTKLLNSEIVFNCEALSRYA